MKLDEIERNSNKVKERGNRENVYKESEFYDSASFKFYRFSCKEVKTILKIQNDWPR